MQRTDHLLLMWSAFVVEGTVIGCLYQVVSSSAMVIFLQNWRASGNVAQDKDSTALYFGALVWK